MPDPKLTLVFAAKDLASKSAHGLRGALLGVHGAAMKAGGGLKGAIGRVFDLKKAFLVATGAVAGLVAGLLASVKAASNEQTGIIRLNTALKDNIKGWKGNTAWIEKRIAAQEKLGFSDDEQRLSLSTLVIRYKDLAKAQQVQTLAMDVARARHISLTDATTLTAKALDGNKKILSQLGIAFDKNGDKSKLFGKIQAKVGGQAKAFGDSTDGMAESIKITFGDVVEDLGGLFLPVVKTVFGFIRDTAIPALAGIVHGIGDWVKNNQPLITQVGGALVTAIQAVAKFLGDAIPAVVDFGGHVFAVAKKVAEFVVPKIQAFVGSLTGKGGVFDSIGKVLGPIVKDLIPKLGTVADAFFKLTGKIGDFIGVLWGDGKGPLAIAVKAAGALLGTLMDFSGPILDFIGNLFTGLGEIIKRIREILGLTSSKVNKVTGGLDAAKGAGGTGGTGGNNPHTGANATGGLLAPGGMYSIGERPGRREDVVVGPGGAMVYSGNSGAGMGGGAPVVIQLVLDKRVVGQVVDDRLYWAISRASPSAVRK